MFNLEHSIANWRKEMTAAGIETPVPLEELEFHLREEIARQIKSGLNETEAFNVAVQTIGEGYVLQDEFHKIEAEGKAQRIAMTVLRIIGATFGWLAAIFALFFFAIDLELHWDFFYFHERWDWETLVAISGILAIETGIWFLAKASRHPVIRAISLVICLFLAFIAFREQLPPESGKPSPLWYRGTLTLFYLLPGIFWLWWE